ncbi:hypothetical protein J7T55_011931 [Diaporthe amygdali]|uniref:uncharacterized protein n=1 Tax=Phomopsis amygdali TaxID=1214568 RepID=UPI0022FE07BD|nr:uncharacterized protein J7T55_011931 [Diaporthe amygdali]KAJ0123466.1 hypothetical protein J7T55_011931 [Diaporthe amygdali]
MTTSMSTSSTTIIPPLGKATQQPTYTTAGTLYNPTITPLQPPSRRGRASRWAPPSHAELALFNKSVLAGFPYKPSRSPPTTASSLKHYTPLQQNSDRAIEPPTGPKLSERTLSESSSTLSLNSAPSQENMNSLNSNGRLLEETRLTDDEKDEDELIRMSVLPVRTITNLASYPNPSQKLAQKALDRARETFKAAAETSRSLTPNLSQHGSQRREGPGARSTSTNVDRENLPPSGWISKHDQSKNATRSSVLSSGPGAPQPLTAGPPGQRQYKPSTLEATFRALQSGNQKQSSATDETYLNTDSSLVNMGISAKITAASRIQSPDQAHLATKDYFEASQPIVNPTANMVLRYDPSQPRRRTQDTLSAEAVRVYFPDGFPPDLGPPTVPLLSNSAGRPEGRFPPTQEELRLRNARCKVAFYSATQDLTKTLDARIAEAQDKLRDLELGFNSARERNAARNAEIDLVFNSSKLGKPRHEFSIDFANELPTHEAAIPLVNMAFSTLLNYWADGRLMDVPTGFGKMEDNKT